MATIKSVAGTVIDGDWIESKDQSDFGIRLIQTGNIGIGEYLDKRSKAKFISEETFDRLKCTEVLPGDILISRLPDPIGRACVVPQQLGKAITAVDCTIVRLNKEIIDNQFFLNYTQSPKYFNQLQQFLAGTTRTRISRKNLEKIEVPLPNLTEQYRIATVLDKVINLISLRKQQLAKLDELVKAQFVEMFGESRTNPRGWHTVRLDEIADVGSSKRVFVEELQEGGIPFYRGTEIGILAEGKDVKPELFITPEHYRILCKATGAPAIGDLLMPSICPDGRIWLVDNNKPFYFKDGRVLWVHPTSADIESCYLQYAMKEKIVDDYTHIASGTTFAELKLFVLKALLIMMPPMEQQINFSLFISATNKQKLTIQKSLDKLEVLKKSLMQEYFG